MGVAMWLGQVKATHKAKKTEQRLGQFMMNQLWNENTELYKKVAGTDADPFYQDKLIPAFEAWLWANWEAR